MTHKRWFYLFWIQFILIIVIVVVSAFSSISASNFKEANIGTYLEDALAYREAYGGYIPEDGYIPNAKAASKVAEAIVDPIFAGRLNVISGTTVEHDAANRLWKVHRWYLFHLGATIVIDQDSGEVLDVVFHK